MFNSQVTPKHLYELIALDTRCKDFLAQAAHTLNLSTRTIHRTIKLARTIADIQDHDDVQVSHLAEALRYRNKTMFVEEGG